MNRYTLIGIILLLAVVGLGSYYAGKGQKEVITEEKIVYKEGEEKIVYRDREIIRETIKRPDGTIEEREISRDISKEIERRSKEIAQEEIAKSKPILSKYSLGLQVWAPISLEALSPTSYSLKNLEIRSGYRLFGEVWVEGGYRLDNSVSIGLAVKF